MYNALTKEFSVKSQAGMWGFTAKGGGAKFNQEVNGTAPCLYMFASSRGEYFHY